jgi:hypothetical protein
MFLPRYLNLNIITQVAIVSQPDAPSQFVLSPEDALDKTAI